jgi:hypothetical protein
MWVMSPVRIASIALAALIVFGRPAAAHDFWIEPSSYRPEPGSLVRVHLRVGQHFEGDLVPRQEDLIDRFEVDTPSQRIPVAGVNGVDPAGFATIDDAGTHVLIYQSRGSTVELPADRFETYLKEEGLERVIAQRAAHGTSESVGRERFFRCAKSLLLSGTASGELATPSGLTLELVPRFDPSQLRAGDPLRVTLLFRGRPLAGALVSVLAKGDPLHATSTRTDGRGDATLLISGRGPYLVKSVWMEAAPARSDVDWDSWWASLDFDVVDKP